MSEKTAHELRALGGEELRREATRADRAVGNEINRLRATDPQFRQVIDYALRVEDEQLRRRRP